MKHLKGILFAIISSGTFGMIPLFTIPIMTTDKMDDFSILFYRFLFSTILMGLVVLFRKESFKIPLKSFLPIFILGLFYALTAFFLIWSYKYLDSGVATTIHFMYPIMVAFIMIFIFKETKSNAVLLAALLSVVGVVLLCWTSGTFSWAGILIVSCTILTYSTYIVGINKSSVGRLNAEILTFYILLSGAVIFFIVSCISPAGLQIIPSTHAFTHILGLAILCTIISDFTLILAIKLIGSMLTSILGSMEPLVAVVIGVFYFNENLQAINIVGLIVIITSVVLVIIYGNNKKIES